MMESINKRKTIEIDCGDRRVNALVPTIDEQYQFARCLVNAIREQHLNDDDMLDKIFCVAYVKTFTDFTFGEDVLDGEGLVDTIKACLEFTRMGLLGKLSSRSNDLRVIIKSMKEDYQNWITKRILSTC